VGFGWPHAFILYTQEDKMFSWFTDSFSQDIWEKKYKGMSDNIYGYYNFLASAASLGDNALAKRFLDLMWNKKFSPGGRILAFAGRPEARLSLMNCTTHAVGGDSLEDINVASMAIMRASSRGQGIGIDISKLRPKDSPVNNAARTSTGAVSFMEMFNHIGGTIGQEGRRAAMLFSIDIDHPDLYRPTDDGVPYDFMNIKRIPGRVENANISVRVSDNFMNAYLEDRMWNLRYTGKSGGEVFHVERSVPAKELFYALAKSAHASAEPGLLYWDTSREMSNSDLFGDQWKIVGTNACSEEVLDQEGVCNLGSINLAAYVINPFSDNAKFDLFGFVEDVELAVEFLDNIIDLEIKNGNYISGRQYDSLTSLRRIGLGVMGFADMLAMLGIEYSVEDSYQTVRPIFQVFRDAAYAASVKLARRKGPAGVWNTSEDYHSSIIEAGFFKTLPDVLRKDILRYGIRNITVTSLAPTGTISNLLGVSSGIEPVFAHKFTRLTRINGDSEYIDYYHPGIQRALDLGFRDADKRWQTAYEVSPKDHVGMQAIVQEFIDASIAKTLNFPSTATPEDVLEAYEGGWTLGLKGMAVYVDGSRTDQVLSAKEEASDGCPECGSRTVHADGCEECHTCGWGRCAI